MQSMADEPARLRIVSFAIHSARGVIRDQSTRRWVMFITLVVAMLMLFCGHHFFSSNRFSHRANIRVGSSSFGWPAPG